MRPICVLFVLGLLSTPVFSDHANTDIHWPGWRVESSEELYLGRIHASYPLTFLFDGKPETAWVFSGKAKGTERKVVLTIAAEKPFTLDRIRVMNGYNKSREVFLRNDRVTGLSLDLRNPEEGCRGGPSVYAAKVQLTDRMGWHEISFPRRTAREIEITVTDLIRGADDDVCLSEIEIYDGDRKVDTAMPEVVLFSEGDECGCGYFSRVMRRDGRILGGDKLEEDGIGPTYDPLNRHAAFTLWASERASLCVVDMTTGRVLLRRKLASWRVDGIAWVKPGMVEVRFYGVEPGKTPRPLRLTVPAATS